MFTPELQTFLGTADGDLHARTLHCLVQHPSPQTPGWQPALPGCPSQVGVDAADSSNAEAGLPSYEELGNRPLPPPVRVPLLSCRGCGHAPGQALPAPSRRWALALPRPCSAGARPVEDAGLWERRPRGAGAGPHSPGTYPMGDLPP